MHPAITARPLEITALTLLDNRSLVVVTLQSGRRLQIATRRVAELALFCGVECDGETAPS